MIAENCHISPSPRFPRYIIGANWHYYGPTMTEEQLDEDRTLTLLPLEGDLTPNKRDCSTQNLHRDFGMTAKLKPLF